MTRRDALGQRLRKVLDRVARMQRPERRRDLERAIAEASNRVTGPTIRLREGLAASHASFLSERGLGQRARDGDG